MNLSPLSMEFIFSHLNANKRIQLSMSYPSIREVEKSVPLKVESLNFHDSSVTINSTTYRLGEIVDIPDAMAGDTIRITNNSGGFDWWTQGDEVVEPGDIQFEDDYCKYLESQKYQIWKKIRSCFMEASEKYLDGEHQLNPMSFLDAPDWYNKLDRIFKASNASHFGLTRYPRCFLEKVRNVEGGEEHETEQEYPRAFEMMENRLNELRDNGEKSDILRKLTYLPKELPMFAAFSIVQNWDYFVRSNARKCYSSRIPENITPRRAFKQFTCAVLGGRPPIQAGFFSFREIRGIFGLPEGLRVKADFLELSSGADLLNAYKTVVSDVNSMVIYFPDKAEIFELDIVKNCRRIVFSRAFSEAVIDNIEHLMCESIYLREFDCRRSHFQDVNLIIGNWSKNPNRKIGSKLYIETKKNISEVFDSEHLRRLGFRNGNNESDGLFLYPTKDKQLRVREDKNQLPIESRHLGGYSTNYYFYLEVLDKPQGL